MPVLAYYDRRLEKHVERPDPSPDDIEILLEEMGTKPGFFHLHMPSGTLTCINVNSSRVRVHFSGSRELPEHQSGTLFDPSHLDSRIKVKIVTDPQVGRVPIYETVRKAMAQDVAIYYLHRDKLPKSIGIWRGTMDIMLEDD